MTSSAPIGDDDLTAFVDGRLAPERKAAVEAALQTDPEAAARVAADQAQRDALRGRLAAKVGEPIPPRLRAAAIAAARRERRWHAVRQAAAAVVLVAIGAAGGYGLHGTNRPVAQAPTAQVTRDAVAAWRMYTAEVLHPVEVAATEQKHLLQWLSKRIGRPLAAPDLAQFGYRLVGGRLLPAGNAAAAQLMYDTEGGARLTLYVRAGEGGETAFRYKSDGDLSTFAWLDRGFGFAVSAAVSREKLQPIVDAVYRDFEPR